MKHTVTINVDVILDIADCLRAAALILLVIIT